MSSDIISSIATIVSKAAPLLGSLLGSGTPAIVNSVLSIISKEIGTSAEPIEIRSKIDSMDESYFGKIELEHAQKLKELSIQELSAKLNHEQRLYQIDRDDRESARKMAMERMKKGQCEWFPMLFAGGLMIILVYIISIIAFSNTDSNDVQLITVILGVVSTKISTIVDFYFGSANGSTNGKK